MSYKKKRKEKKNSPSLPKHSSLEANKKLIIEQRVGKAGI